MNILIVKLSAIGDVIHTLPALNAVRLHYPKAKITWVVEEAAASIIQEHEALDRVLVSKRKSWFKGLLKGSLWKQSIVSIYKFIKELQDTEYDLVIDFHQLLKSGIIVWLAKGRVKAGFDKGMQHMEHSYLFLNKRIKPVSMELHALLRYLMLVYALGIPVNKIEYQLPIKKNDEKFINDLLYKNKINPKNKLIAINPVAQWKTKLWENHKFARLADSLVKEYNADIVFTGGPDDKPVIDNIISFMKTKAVNFAGKTSLKTLGALYKKACLVISTDTGPMHLAASVSTPVAAIFGPTAPWRTGPFGSGHKIVNLTMECSPCFKRECAKNCICMKNILVDDVLEKVRTILR